MKSHNPESNPRFFFTFRKSCSEERPIALHLLGGDQKADSNLGDRLAEMTEALIKAGEAGEARVASLLHRAVAMVALLAAKVRGLVESYTQYDLCETDSKGEFWDIMTRSMFACVCLSATVVQRGQNQNFSLSPK